MALAALNPRQDAVRPAVALTAFDPEAPELQAARALGQTQRLNYAGSLSPDEAWQLFARQAAALVDVRTHEERKFVGYVPGSLHVPWLLGTAMQTNPRFLRELETKFPKHAVLLLLCRSGQRSAAAAAAAAKAGFQHAYSVTEGFEGELDEHQHRGQRNGWRQRGFPWLQD
jgi:rhodanese-related sulfurtransferase